MTFRNPSRAAVSLTLGMGLLIATTIFAQQLSATQSDDELTTKLVCEMVSRKHISHKPIDDNISERLLNRYVKSLDRQKLYFTKADIAELQQYKTTLDDKLKEGNVDFAYSTFDMYLQRLERWMAEADKFVDVDHDFTIDESVVIDSDDLDWAADDAELRERWRKQVKNDLLSLIIDDITLPEARTRLHKRYHNLLTQMRQTERFEQLEMYLSSLTHCFDPHSSYMSKETLEDFRIQMELKLQGIGAALRSEDGYTVVAQIVPGGAAEKDGRLKVGDKIIGVAQGDEDFVDIVEMKLSRVVRYIRGPKGSTVRLQVRSADDNEIHVYELTRQVIELKSAEVKGEIIETGDRLGGPSKRIGVINIPSFYRDFRMAQQGVEDFKSTARDVKQVLQSFYDQGGVDGIVVDLRTNGGGALSEAIEVTGLFIRQGPVVQVKNQDGRVTSHNDEDPDVYYTGPLVVLCNRLSASASEIFAGAIRDYRRGIVVGDSTTHGKGTVQNVLPVSRKLFLFGNEEDRGALKLTINQFYRVNGDSTQSLGVESDIVLPSLLDHMDLGESSLDNALAFDQVPAAGYTPLSMVNERIISDLRNASQQRVKTDEEFQEVEEEIARYLERKERTVLSLNEAERRAEQAENERADANEEEEEELDTTPDPDGPIFPEGYYNDEVLHIAVDYVNLFKQMTAQKN